jgi:hypothetical protein
LSSTSGILVPIVDCVEDAPTVVDLTHKSKIGKSLLLWVGFVLIVVS